MKTVLITGIGGLTPRSIAKVIRKNHPDYKIIGCDVDKRAIGFFAKMNDGRYLVDESYVAPSCYDEDYFSFIELLVKDRDVDYAFVQPEAEIVEWCDYYEKHGKYPCPTFMGSKILSVTLRDKSLMAELLEGTKYIPKTIKITQDNPRNSEVEDMIGFPCWIRATEGTGGFGSLKLDDLDAYHSWLFINSDIKEFTVSEFLPGRHLANQMLFFNGEYIKGASLECVDYIMEKVAPSHVTGNTHFGRFLNDKSVNAFCNECIEYIEHKLGIPAHGILSFDLKEDKNGDLKVTEINIRHMAYTGIMSELGFDLIEDTIKIIEDENCDSIKREPYFCFDKPYIFLRDVDVDPIIIESDELYEPVTYVGGGQGRLIYLPFPIELEVVA